MIRALGLRGAVAVNVITMIGIGPLITIPLVLADLHGSTALWAWVAGAVIALCDGLAWAELGSLYPGSGGTYVFLREAFGRDRWGRLFAFLFAWQIVLSGPLVLATGYIGFAQYAAYLWPALGSNPQSQGIVAASVGIATLVLLYRRIHAIGAISIALAGISIATLVAVIAAGVAHFSSTQAFSLDPHAGTFAAIGAGLGPALVITLYDYYGYGQSCTVSDEVHTPARVLPLSVVGSILIVGVLYVALQVSVLGALPWRDLVTAMPDGTLPDAGKYVASALAARVWGAPAAIAITIAVLITAFASTFGNLLGYSRIPYAAAVDGVFLGPFAALDARGRFPHVALVTIGLLALPACFFSLGAVISALTAGLVVIQSLAQLAALAALRARGIHAPYRMSLYPLPLVVAAVSWVYIFCSSGLPAIGFGTLTLAAGVAAFVWRARRAREWPFQLKAATLVALAFAASAGPCALAPEPAEADPLAVWGHGRIVERGDTPVFEVDGSPFFLYGAAFFYERLPRDKWDSSMGELQELGINTLDLYVPWNWHELADGDFDFNGRTNPRRDLDEVLRLARVHKFEIVLRPGPVIRNEWRNGGYPAWLLQRPEYGMPLHDLLEGRYPPTATLQNAHSDDAAAEWMRNQTHMRYARRWLERVLQECQPYADRIVAVALDDDQGAYLDNQTWPAPHLRSYLEWLRGVVHGVTGPRELTFINTYQMKVPASSPVWSMGNWYQSDTYELGEHDVAQLAFSTGLLHTRPHQPLFASEFQAGWLEQPDDIRPRPADPRNTSLALAEMIGMGVRGIVNFPAQDTLYPAGWEVPFANSFYAWDAALTLDGEQAQRAAPTAAIGSFVRTFGTHLAESQPAYDAAIAYLGASFPLARSDNALFAAVASQTIAAQAACRAAQLSCALVDPVATSPSSLRRHYSVLIVPLPLTAHMSDLAIAATQRLRDFVRLEGRLVAGVPSPPALLSALRSAGLSPIVEGVPGGAFAPDSTGILDGFLGATNDTAATIRVAHGSVTTPSGRRVRLPDFIIPAHSGLVAAVGIHMARMFPSFGFGANDAVFLTDCGFAPGTSPWEIDAEPEVSSCQVYTSAEDANHFPGGPVSRIEAPNYEAFSAERGHFMEYLVEPDPTPPPAPPVLQTPTIPVRSDAVFSEAPRPLPRSAEALAYLDDAFRDGDNDIILDNKLVRVMVSPGAGARAFLFQDDETERNVFTSVGAMRDDVAVEPPPSTTDRIAAYTHDFPAGMFNRAYDAAILQSGNRAVARFSYDAPDVIPNGARFERTVTLEPNARAFTVDETADIVRPPEPDVSRSPSASAPATAQRCVSVTSLSVGDGATMTTQQVFAPSPAPFSALTTIHVRSGHALAFYDTATHDLASIAWRAGDVEDATIIERRYSIVVRLTLAPGRTTHVRYGYDLAATLADAGAALAAADAAAQEAGRRSPP